MLDCCQVAYFGKSGAHATQDSNHLSKQTNAPLATAPIRGYPVYCDQVLSTRGIMRSGGNPVRAIPYSERTQRLVEIVFLVISGVRSGLYLFQIRRDMEQSFLTSWMPTRTRRLFWFLGEQDKGRKHGCVAQSCSGGLNIGHRLLIPRIPEVSQSTSMSRGHE